MHLLIVRTKYVELNTIRHYLVRRHCRQYERHRHRFCISSVHLETTYRKPQFEATVRLHRGSHRGSLWGSPLSTNVTATDSASPVYILRLHTGSHSLRLLWGYIEAHFEAHIEAHPSSLVFTSNRLSQLLSSVFLLDILQDAPLCLLSWDASGWTVTRYFSTNSIWPELIICAERCIDNGTLFWLYWDTGFYALGVSKWQLMGICYVESVRGSLIIK